MWGRRVEESKAATPFWIPLVFILIVGSIYQANAQRCGTAVTPSVLEHWQETEPMREGVYLQRRSSPDLVAVSIHIIRETGGTGGLAESNLKTIMEELNTYYSAANIQFYQCGAVNYIDNSTYYDFEDTEESALCSGNDVANTINIYFANSVTSGGNSACGYAYYPGGQERILMDNSCALNGSTMIHEMGHFFYLFHTHETALGNELVNGSNCGTAGDQLCDTPADPQLTSDSVDASCVYNGTITDANGDPYSPQTNNIMSYSRKSCRDLLTSDQFGRIETANAAYRTNLHSSCSAYDVGVSDIQSISCGSMDPTITVKNYGNTTITSFDLKYEVDGGGVNTYSWSGSLSALSTTQVTLSLGLTGSHAIVAYTKDPNSNSDVVNYNDTLSTTVNAITSSMSSFPYSESFESDFGSWNQSGADDFDWTRQTGSTISSSTGPSGSQDGSYYIYLEASSPNYPDKSSTLETCVDFSGYTDAEITFYYHMYGTGMGTLQLLVSADNGLNWSSVWSESGDQGNSWSQTTVDLSAYDGSEVQLRFAGETASDWYSDMAIDNMVITATASSSGVSWVGTTTDWNTGSNWNPSGVPDSSDDITINGNVSNQPVIGSGDVEVGGISFSNSGIITVNNSASLTIYGDISGISNISGSGTTKFSSGTHDIDAVSTVTGVLEVPTGVTLNTNGNLTLADGASLMHGTGTTGGGGTVNGAVKIKRSAASGSQAFNIFGSPISSAGASVLGSRVYWFNEQNNDPDDFSKDWQQTTGPMTVARGYIVAGAGNVTFNGAVNDGNQSIAVTSTASANSNEDAWNCISNPYPSSIDAVAFINANSSLINGENIYLWDNPNTNQNNFSVGDYATFNKTLGGVAGGGGNSPNGDIASCQGFFIKATGAGTINFTNVMRTAQNDQFLRQTVTEAQRFKITVTNPNGAFNETMVAFKSDATDAFDANYDAPKNKGNAALALYTELNDEPYAIQAFDRVFYETKTIPLKLEGTVSGTYTFRVSLMSNFDETALIILEDLETGATQNLRLNPEYTFTGTANDLSDRFLIHFTPTLQVNPVEASCSGDDGFVSLISAGVPGWEFTLMDEEANVIDAGQLLDTIVIAHLNSGIYQVELQHSSGYGSAQLIELDGKSPVEASFESEQQVGVGQPIWFTNTSIGADNYTWNFGGNNISSNKNPVYVFMEKGTYEVRLTAANQECEDNTMATIYVTDLVSGIENQNQEVINIYGAQNRLIIKSATTEKISVHVYNVVGKQVFYRDTMFPNEEIDLNVSEGVYIARIIAGGVESIRKIYVTR